MSSLADKTIEEASRYIKLSMNAGYSGGLLQSIDPAIAFLSSVILLAATISTRNIISLLILFSLSISLALLSNIPVRDYLVRVLVFIPIFTAIIAIPSIFSQVTPGETVASVTLGTIALQITREGLINAATFVFRVSVAVSFPVLLVMCKDWDDVVDGMASLKIPSIVVEILSMTYRYIITMIDTAMEMLLSRKSRLVGRESFKDSWKWGGELLGALFMKSARTSTEVFMSMVSRGFSGEIGGGDPEISLSRRDITFLVVTFMIVASLILGEVFLWGKFSL